ncbi:hypothetical protein VN23_14260 [Janthinobacterium sp. B9-8]|nr:hypothetical protein VN23_14260 [Janthinobacterium sp. B9-8]
MAIDRYILPKNIPIFLLLNVKLFKVALKKTHRRKTPSRSSSTIHSNQWHYKHLKISDQATLEEIAKSDYKNSLI